MSVPILPVSSFTQLVADHLSVLGEVCVEGEISQMQVSQGKWLFLTLKDQAASISVFAPAFKITALNSLTDGMKVHVFGTASLYQKTGRFSLNAYRIVPAGEGALRLAYEQLKTKLQAEGLFDATRKRKIPRLPEHIGLITAVDARAYTDFTKVLAGRLGGLTITFYPVQVQGANSVPSILKAFEYFNRQVNPPDVIVLTRGGGSLEDLLSFNDEAVARAVFSCRIPVISAIGHEADQALTDFVADLRASTPSNAAELLVQSRQELLQRVDHLTLRIDGSLTAELRDQQRLVNYYGERLGSILRIHQTRAQKLTERLGLQLAGRAQSLIQKQNNRSFLVSQLHQLMTQKTIQTKQKIQNLERLLSTLDYQKVLARGFSITRTESGKIVTNAADVLPNTKITTTLAQGTLSSTV
jgi:exodeoxyribonuclease VII large subunit